MKLLGKYKLLLLTLGLFILPCLIWSNSSFYDNVNTLYSDLGLSDDRIDVIVIDPGHGGKDVGCHGHKVNEKDIALEIAQKLGAMVSEAHPEIRIRYTRTDDSFVPLHQRVAMANEDDVDLFISLHCNALKDPSAHGIETYVMGIHTSNENMAIAKRENDVIHLEDLSGFSSDYDPYSAEGHIMLAMQQQSTLEKSISLAGFTQEAISSKTSFRDRGVKQAGFVVLRKVLVPSILVEAGFISNPKDVKLLKSAQHQSKIAESILHGITEYIRIYQEQ